MLLGLKLGYSLPRTASEENRANEWLCVFLCFLRQTLLCAHDWPGICSVGQTTSEIHLPLFPSPGTKGMHHHAWVGLLLFLVFSDSWVSENLESFLSSWWFLTCRTFCMGIGFLACFGLRYFILILYSHAVLQSKPRALCSNLFLILRWDPTKLAWLILKWSNLGRPWACGLASWLLAIFKKVVILVIQIDIN